MNGARDFGIPLTDAQFREVLASFYKWFEKWKMIRTEEQFDAATAAWMQLMRKFQFWKFPTVAHVGISVIYELDGRLHAGFTECTSKKLLSLLEAEAGK